MNKDLQKYYEDYFAMFSTDGWKQFVSDVSESIEVFKIEDIKDERQLSEIQGQLKQLKGIINFQASIEHSYEAADGDS
jgi:hypothetical protein